MPRPRWDALEPALRADIGRLAGGRIVDARSCPGGFSPGFASRLTLAGGGRVFVKAIDARRWPHEVAAYRAEARVNAALPAGTPAPRFLAVLERAGLDTARGGSLVHCDLYPHNILLTPDRVVVVDWPHARLGAPVVD